MQRIVFAALVGLSLAIGLTVGTVAWRTASFDRTLPDLGVADPSAGHAFYAGIDQVLAGGDPSALKQAVTGDFVDHVGDGETDRSADELIEDLTAFGASFPGTQIQVTDMQASASSLVAAIAPIAPKPVPVAGMTLTAQASNGGYEVLRIRNGKVSERWTAGLPEISTTTFEAASFTTSATANVATRLDRIVLPRGSSYVHRFGGPAMLVVEQGAVRFGMDFINSANEPEQRMDTLAEGSAVGVKPGARIRLEADGNDPTQLLLYSTQRAMPVDAPSPTLTGGAASSMLWTSNLPVAEHGAWQVAIGNVRLPGGQGVDLEAPEGTMLLLCSEGGAVQVMAEGGDVETLDASFTAAGEGNASTIDAGAVASVSEAGRVSLRSAPDTAETVWLITIVPDDVPATPGP